jgi:hypothetical protein
MGVESQISLEGHESAGNPPAEVNANTVLVPQLRLDESLNVVGDEYTGQQQRELRTGLQERISVGPRRTANRR